MVNNSLNSRKKFFGAFIMTFERPKILIETIKKVQNQLYPPEVIYVIDNSYSRDTEIILEKLDLNNIIYFRVGYNSGPAGASKIGLTKLADEGYKWIYWGDDDDPPRNNLEFQQIFEGIKKLQSNNVFLGIIGGKGGSFNKFTGRTKSLTNAELKKSDFVEVDVVPGNHTMVVNAEIIDKGILPNENLFFGFEELDFCLKVKKKQYKIYITAHTWLQVRLNANLINNNYHWKSSSFGKTENLIRDYYSTRNLLYILKSNKLYFAFLILLGKSLFKIPYSFKFGFKYGMLMSKVQINAISDFFTNKFGKQLLPKVKKKSHND